MISSSFRVMSVEMMGNYPWGNLSDEISGLMHFGYILISEF